MLVYIFRLQVLLKESSNAVNAHRMRKVPLHVRGERFCPIEYCFQIIIGIISAYPCGLEQALQIPRLIVIAKILRLRQLAEP